MRLTPLIGPLAVLPLLLSRPAHAESFSLNYADLSTLESPIVFRAGQMTLVVSGLVDGGARLNLANFAPLSHIDTGVTANFTATAETQLGNRWTVGGSYFGQYDSFGRAYTANSAAFVRTSWGSIIGGNVGGLLREDTRRRRAPGLASLGYDDFLGQNARWGGVYRLVSGPYVSGVMVDEDGDVEVGTVYQRPYGTHDIRWSLRGRYARIRDAQGNRRFSTAGIGGVTDLTYGSSIYDLGLGYERITGQGLALDRWFASAGARTKIQALSLSLEGHIGAVDGSPEYAAAAGLAYSFARGMSANLGLNYKDANVVRNGVNVLVGKSESAAFSLRYSY